MPTGTSGSVLVVIVGPPSPVGTGPTLTTTAGQRHAGLPKAHLGHVAQVGVLRVIRARCHRLWLQRNAVLGAIAGMVLLDFRVHRTRVYGLGRKGCDVRHRTVIVINRFTCGFVSG